MPVGRDGDMTRELTLAPDYPARLADLKARVRTAQHWAHRLVNTEMLALFWEIGDAIDARQETAGWGAKVIDRLAADLRAQFPAMTGLSRRNLYYMRVFAEGWPDPRTVQNPSAQLPWGHITLLLGQAGRPRCPRLVCRGRRRWRLDRRRSAQPDHEASRQSERRRQRGPFVVLMQHAQHGRGRGVPALLLARGDDQADGDVSQAQLLLT